MVNTPVVPDSAASAAPDALPAQFAQRTPYDKQGMVTESVPCCRCGYDVRGLHLQAICPECREPVARSVVGDLLAFMPAERVRALHKGLGLVSLGSGLSVLLPIALIVISIVFGVAAAGGAAMPEWFVVMLSAGLLLGGLAVLTAGWWSLGSVDGSGSETKAGRTARRACVLMAVGYLAWAAQFFLGSLGPGPGGGAGPGAIGVVPAIGISGVTGLVLFPVWIGFSAAYVWHAQQYLSMIARRAPDPLLEHRARSRRLSGVLLWTVGVLVFFLGPLVAISNLMSTVKDCRFHTKRALQAAASGGGHPRPEPVVDSAGASGGGDARTPDRAEDG
ncbi:MAG: hypothetical protein AAGF47_06080 [Planctomycetota bacterium]